MTQVTASTFGQIEWLLPGDRIGECTGGDIAIIQS